MCAVILCFIAIAEKQETEEGIYPFHFERRRKESSYADNGFSGKNI
jgi:hypothetical protein